MQDLHAHCNLRVIRCKLCSEERSFDGHTIDQIESWKDRHYKDGRPVCIGAYKPHVRDALEPILAAGQPRMTLHVAGPGTLVPLDPSTPRNPLNIRILDEAEWPAEVNGMSATIRRVPESSTRNDNSHPRLVYDDVGLMDGRLAVTATVSTAEFVTSLENLCTALESLSVDLPLVEHPLIEKISFREWKDEARRCYHLTIEMDYHDGRIKGFQWATDEVEIYYGNRKRFWLEYVRNFEGSTGIKWKELPFTYANWEFLIGYDYRLFGNSPQTNYTIPTLGFNL